MTIDWQKEAENRQADLLQDLKALLRIDSTRDVEHATEAAPLGPGPAKALTTMLEMAERDGFSTKNVDNVAGRIEYGEGAEILGLFGHMDVVPAGPGWTTDPFTPAEENGNLIARGSADDKGPSIAAYYALKIVRDLGLPVNKRIHFILGTDEESEWVGMDRYLKSEPAPDFGFSPDAEFPIINGEKGIATFLITFKPVKPQVAALTMTTFEAGLRPNMVPQEATATIVGTLPDALRSALDTFGPANGVTISTAPVQNGLTITLTGKGAHAQEPKDGVNAATFLATLLAPYDFDPASAQFLNAIARLMHEDSRGHLLGVNYTDKVMGDLTASPNLYHFTQDGAQTVAINVRYPQGTDADTIRDQMETALGADVATVTVSGHAQPPHYVSGDDPLVQTLLNVFEQQTGLAGHEQVIGGGTYGRIIARGVAFGAQMPEQENVMHQANEYMPIKDIIKATAIYAQAISELVK